MYINEIYIIVTNLYNFGRCLFEMFFELEDKKYQTKEKVNEVNPTGGILVEVLMDFLCVSIGLYVCLSVCQSVSQSRSHSFCLSH